MAEAIPTTSDVVYKRSSYSRSFTVYCNELADIDESTPRLERGHLRL